MYQLICLDAYFFDFRSWLFDVLDDLVLLDNFNNLYRFHDLDNLDFLPKGSGDTPFLIHHQQW